MGHHDVEDYRKVGTPPDETRSGDHSDIRSDESEDDEEYEDEYDGEHAHQERTGHQFWPNKAIHDEKSFGYLFDAARSTLCEWLRHSITSAFVDSFAVQYTFKEDLRPDVLPVWRCTPIEGLHRMEAHRVAEAAKNSLSMGMDSTHQHAPVYREI